MKSYTENEDHPTESLTLDGSTSVTLSFLLAKAKKKTQTN